MPVTDWNSWTEWAPYVWDWVSVIRFTEIKEWHLRPTEAKLCRTGTGLGPRLGFCSWPLYGDIWGAGGSRKLRSLSKWVVAGGKDFRPSLGTTALPIGSLVNVHESKNTSDPEQWCMLLGAEKLYWELRGIIWYWFYSSECKPSQYMDLKLGGSGSPRCQRGNF